MDNPKLRAALFFPRRLVWLILAFLVMTAIIAAFMGAAPGDPAQMLGPSVRTGQPVKEEIGHRLPVTLQPLGLATLVGMVLSVLIILVGALVLGLRGKVPILGAILQRLGQIGVSLGTAMPAFILGLFLLYLFGFKLNWFPVAGWGGGLKHAVLPALTLAILPACLVARSVLGEIAHYRAIAVENRSTLLLHAVLSFFGYGLIQAIGMLGGVLFVETIFSLPGIGRLFVESIFAVDYPVMFGLVMSFLIWALVLRALADLVQGIDGFVLLKLEAVEPEATAPTPVERPSYVKVLGFVWIVFCLLLVIIPSFQGIGGLLTGGDRIVEQNLMDNLLPPGSESADGFIYAWGTDAFGRDIRSRALYALGLDLGSSLAIAVIVLALALPGGLLAGYLAKVGTIWADLLDDLVMFPVEVLTSVPGLTLLIFILFIGGPGLWNLWVWLALAFLLPRGVRMVRDWWLATSPEKALWLRVVSIALGVLILSTALAVVTQPVVGFVGLGTQPPQPDLGLMLNEGMISMRTAPHVFLRPAQTLLFAAFGWFLLADTLLSKFGIYKREAWLELNR